MACRRNPLGLCPPCWLRCYLSWDTTLNSIKDAGIRIENPKMWSPPPKPKLAEQIPLIKDLDAEHPAEETHPEPPLAVTSKETASDSVGAESQAGTESGKVASAPNPSASEPKG